MSAIIAITQRHAVHVLVDTASVDDADGTISYFVSKVLIFQHARTTVAFRGMAGHAIMLAPLGRLDTFEDIVTVAPELVVASEKQGHPLELVVAGIARDESPACFAMPRGDQLVPVTYCVAPPGSAADLSDLAQRDYLDWDPVVDGLRIMQSQRRQRVAKHFQIGGACVLTSVHQDKIESRIIHKWADKVGERITP